MRVAWIGAAGLALLAPSLVAPEPAPPARHVDQVLFLIGDAGNPARNGEPVLQALGRDLLRDPAGSLVLFLGDNLYPKGLPPEGGKNRAEMERRIDTQIETVKKAGARGVFVPGNHDWDKQGPGGWEAVKRIGLRVATRGTPLVDFLPRRGCPGPEVVDLGERVRLILLDTQWWLHGGPKPKDPTSDCPEDSEEEVLKALRRDLGGAGDRIVVAAGHHPLATGGPHGGHFSWREHLFPLTDASSSLWIPLPLIGSIYPLSRKSGSTAQDLSSVPYRRLQAALEGVFRERPPLVYAAGHEHTLQVLEGRSARHYLVSGTGIFGHTSGVVKIEGTRYASSDSGYMRLEFDRDGGVRLAVVVVDAGGLGREAFSEWLREGPVN